MRILLLAIALLPATFADTFNSYAVSEHREMSEALPQLSSDLLWWAFNSEGVSRSALNTQEYGPSTAVPLWGASVLPSSSFSLDGGDTMPVRTVKVAAQTGEIDTVGFNSLLQNPALAALLFNWRHDTGIRKGDILSPLPQFDPGTLPPLTPTSSNWRVWLDSDVISGANASGAGSHQLYFGEHSLDDTWTTDLPAVMVVNSATVPEPPLELWLILAFGLGAVIARGHWR